VRPPHSPQCLLRKHKHGSGNRCRNQGDVLEAPFVLNTDLVTIPAAGSFMAAPGDICIDIVLSSFNPAYPIPDPYSWWRWLKWIEIPKCVLDCDVSRKQDAPLTWGIRQSTRHGARQPSQSHSHRGESARRRVSATGQTWKDSKSGK